MEKMRAAQLGNQMVDLKVRMTADLMEKMMATKSGYLLEVLDIHKKGAALLALL